MKKLLVVLCALFMLCGCQKEYEVLHIDGIKEITYEELTQSLNSPVKFILYIGRPDCGDCIAFYPMLEDYINEHEGMGIYYLNIKEFRDAARKENATKEEKEFFENIYKKLEFDWTPTIQVRVNGKIEKSYQYLNDAYFDIEDRQQQLLKKQEFIDEFYRFMDEYYLEVLNEKMS